MKLKKYHLIYAGTLVTVRKWFVHTMQLAEQVDRLVMGSEMSHSPSHHRKHSLPTPSFSAK